MIRKTDFVMTHKPLIEREVEEVINLLSPQLEQSGCARMDLTLESTGAAGEKVLALVNSRIKAMGWTMTHDFNPFTEKCIIEIV
ncbi:hypothetical protein [Shewanella algidipiscicola]|uniref:hypothetical protein n=1 Tax=Shewanella algidipiscicola TaxID=614070 RepID=UPI000D7850C4|nr:hypothetical protein [Shewanella algidipiscicola]